MTEQQRNIFVIACNRWLTLETIAKKSGQRVASVSAQLRHFRNGTNQAPKGWTVKKRLLKTDGTGHYAEYEYRLMRKK